MYCSGMKASLIQRYEQDIVGVLGCFDRVVVTGTLTEVAYPEALTGLLHREGIRCFDLGQFAEPLRQQIRDNALAQAQADGLTIQYLAKSKGVRKEDLIAKVLAQRGEQPGLVHVISVMESCTTFKPWHDKTTGKTGLKLAPGKCATFYFYLIDEQLGLIYVRVPTWLPCRLQIYFNAHHWLARQLQREGIAFRMQDNAIVECADWKRAQELAERFRVQQWEKKFQELAARFCPVVKKFNRGYHWSVMQVEYALDVVFAKRETLAPVYELLSRESVLTVRVPDMARFWDKRFSPEAVAGSDFKTLVQGTRIKHVLGRQSLKMYDKGRVLRIEATSNDITFFRHHRKVVSRDGREQYKMAALKKSIYSLADVVGILAAVCRRYLDFLGTLADDTPARQDLDRISRTVRDKQQRTWRGFNLFLREDLRVLLAVMRGEFLIHGLSNRRLRAVLVGKTSGQTARILRRLRQHGLLKKVGGTHRYYLSQLGKRLLLAARRVSEHVIVPALQLQPT